MKCYLVHLYIRVTIWNYTRKQTKLRVNKKGSLDFFAPMHHEYLFLFPFFFEFWFENLSKYREFRDAGGINAHAQASAESLPAELSRVDFPQKFQENPKTLRSDSIIIIIISFFFGYREPGGARPSPSVRPTQVGLRPLFVVRTLV